jgi:hypothetical protein
MTTLLVLTCVVLFIFVVVCGVIATTVDAVLRSPKQNYSPKPPVIINWLYNEK